MNSSKLTEVLFYPLLLSLISLFLQNTEGREISADIRIPTADFRFSQDGFLKIDGTARLIIGMYELPKDDERLSEIARNGFNLIRVPQDINALHRVHRHRLYSWICLGSTVKLKESDHSSEQRLEQIMSKFKDHPSLLVWELPDEALWNIWWSRHPWIFGGQQQELRKSIEKVKNQTTDDKTNEWLSLLRKADNFDERGLWKEAEEIYDLLWKELGVKNPHPNLKMSQCLDQADELTDEITRGCQVVKQLDPEHIIWQNHAPRNSVDRMRKYNQAIDAVGCDIYPAPSNPPTGHSDLKDTNISSVGPYTDRMRETAPGKSIWMVLQGFGWRDIHETLKADPDPRKGRRPNFSETRFMAYDAIVHGANAILYWGTHSIKKESSLWSDLMKVARELRALEPGIVGIRPKNTPIAIADETFGSIDGQGPRLMLSKTNKDWVLISVNEHAQGIAFTVKNLPEKMEGKTLYRLYSDETHIVENRTIHDGIRGFGVHVYATSRRFEIE
jgi:hypothetical protein